MPQGQDALMQLVTLKTRQEYLRLKLRNIILSKRRWHACYRRNFGNIQLLYPCYELTFKIKIYNTLCAWRFYFIRTRARLGHVRSFRPERFEAFEYSRQKQIKGNERSSEVLFQSADFSDRFLLEHSFIGEWLMIVKF